MAEGQDPPREGRQGCLEGRPATPRAPVDPGLPGGEAHLLGAGAQPPRGARQAGLAGPLGRLVAPQPAARQELGSVGLAHHPQQARPVGAAVVHVDPRPRPAHPGHHRVVLEAHHGGVREEVGLHHHLPLPRDRPPLVDGHRLEGVESARQPLGVAGPEDRALVAASAAWAVEVRARCPVLVQVLGPALGGGPGQAPVALVAEQAPARRQGVDVEGVRGHLVGGAPVPGLGLHQAGLDAGGRVQARQELEAALELGPELRGARVAAQVLEGVQQEGGHP